VECGDGASNRPQFVIERNARGDQGAEPAIGRHATHHDKVIADVSVGTEHVGDAEIHGASRVEKSRKSSLTGF
jgi:hypothetical protein